MQLKPLFSIGINDIASLEDLARAHSTRNSGQLSVDDASADSFVQGWIACTTDSVLVSKRSLYDIAAHIPSSQSERAAKKVWPHLEAHNELKMKSTQRDLRRHVALRRGILTLLRSKDEESVYSVDNELDSEDHHSLLSKRPRAVNDVSDFDDSLVEPLSWSALACSSFIWWASAGKRWEYLDGEVEADKSLLDGFNRLAPMNSTRARAETDADGDEEMTDLYATIPELAIIAYFHRLTAQTLRTIADMIETAGIRHTPGAAISNDKSVLFVSSADLSRLGLDIWSASDVSFVKELVTEYFGIEAEVQSASIECCGLRIC